MKNLDCAKNGTGTQLRLQENSETDHADYPNSIIGPAPKVLYLQKGHCVNINVQDHTFTTDLKWQSPKFTILPQHLLDRNWVIY